MGEIAENIMHKSAYFSAHQIGNEEIVAYYEKTMNSICRKEGTSPITPTTVDEQGDTMLFHMMRDGITTLLPLMVQMGFDPLHRNLRHESLLHVICEHCLLNDKPLPEVFEIIDSVSAYVGWSDEDNLGRTPLFNVVQMYERWKSMTTLFPVRNPVAETVALIEKAIAEGADIHHRDRNGNTFVSQATSECLAPFQSLIEKQILQQHISSSQARSVRKM